MAEIVIDEMGQLPNNITIDEPIPGKTCFDDPIFFEKSNTKGNCSNRKKA